VLLGLERSDTHTEGAGAGEKPKLLQRVGKDQLDKLDNQVGLYPIVTAQYSSTTL
jgi:hypothetical protein